MRQRIEMIESDLIESEQGHSDLPIVPPERLKSFARVER